MSQEYTRNLKNRLEDFKHKSIMELMTPLETIKRDICVCLQNEYKSPEELVKKEICGLVDARKIICTRHDLLTLEFLVKVLANTGRKSFSASYKEDLLQKYSVLIDEVLPHLKDKNFYEGYKTQPLTLDRLIEFLDIKKGVSISSDLFLKSES